MKFRILRRKRETMLRAKQATSDTPRWPLGLPGSVGNNGGCTKQTLSPMSTSWAWAVSLPEGAPTLDAPIGNPQIDPDHREWQNSHADASQVVPHVQALLKGQGHTVIVIVGIYALNQRRR